MAERTWETVELPLLEAIAAMEAEARGGPSVVFGSSAVERAGLPRYEGLQVLEELRRAGYVRHQGGYDAVNVRLEERARRAVGQWPAEDIGRELIAALEARIAAADSPEEQGALGRLKDAVIAVGTGTITSVLSGVLQQHLGIR